MADDPWADDPRRTPGDAPDPVDGPHADLGTYASDRDLDSPNPKKAIGTGVKVIVGLLIAGGLLMLLCCGGLYWEFTGTMERDETPAGVRARTDEILTLDVPADFEPQLSLRGEIPLLRWIADVRMQMSVYDTPGGGQFLLTKLEVPPGGGADADQMQAQLQQGLDQNAQAGVRVDVTESSSRELLTADGRPVTWTFGEGTGRDGEGKDLGPFHEITGRITDGTNVYVLKIAVAEAEYDEAEIVAMLESIRLVDPLTEPVPAGNEVPLDDEAADAGTDVDADLDADPAIDADAP